MIQTFLQMCDLCRIRQDLTQDVAVLAANVLVSSCLDSFNFLLEVPNVLISTNSHTLAHNITNLRKYGLVLPILKQPHSLPVSYCCIFTTATLVYKFLHSGFPTFLDPDFILTAAPTVPSIIILTVNI